MKMSRHILIKFDCHFFFILKKKEKSVFYYTSQKVQEDNTL